MLELETQNESITPSTGAPARTEALGGVNGLDQIGKALTGLAQTPLNPALAALRLPENGAGVLRDYLDALGTATARATHYNRKQEQVAASRAIHAQMLACSRPLYALLLGLPGTTDYNLQLGVELLLTSGSDTDGLLAPAQEARLLRWLLDRLPPQRVLKLFVQLRLQRKSAARVRRLMLGWLLQPARLELWVVRYRRKLKLVFGHALGQRRASILASVLSKDPAVRTGREQGMLQHEIGRHVPAETRDKVFECVGFVLGADVALSLPKLLAYRQARSKLEAGCVLPFETLEGIRSVYHRDQPSARVLELTRRQLSEGQKLSLQRKAAVDKVEVSFDPMRQSPLKLYLYAFERGIDDAIEAALAQKASEAAARLPLRLGRLGLLLDASASMSGDATQALRPLASALVLRDLLTATAEATALVCAGGVAEGLLVRPQGATDLAAGLLQLVSANPDLIVILSDGYENSPAGRVSELMLGLWQVGIKIPVVQLSPVLAAENAGLRELAPGLIPALPVAEPQALGLGLIRQLVDSDPARAIEALLRLLPQDLLTLVTPVTPSLAAAQPETRVPSEILTQPETLALKGA